MRYMHPVVDNGSTITPHYNNNSLLKPEWLMAFLHIEKEENNSSSPKACSFSEQEDFQILQDVLINRKKN